MAEFFDVEGIPVSVGFVPGANKSSAAWDTDPPRSFDPGSAMRNGAPISEVRFWRLVQEARDTSRLRGKG